MAQKRAAVADHLLQHPIYRPLPQQAIVVQFGDDFPAQRPQVVYVFLNGLVRLPKRPEIR